MIIYSITVSFGSGDWSDESAERKMRMPGEVTHIPILYVLGGDIFSPITIKTASSHLIRTEEFKIQITGLLLLS
jgi:hypothetical protein